jgi:hypothetical protein
MMESTAPFMLAWEAYVLFMLCFFVSIVFRLNRIENKVNKIISEITDMISYILEER